MVECIENSLFPEKNRSDEQAIKRWQEQEEFEEKDFFTTTTETQATSELTYQIETELRHWIQQKQEPFQQSHQEQGDMLIWIKRENISWINFWVFKWIHIQKYSSFEIVPTNFSFNQPLFFQTFTQRRNVTHQRKRRLRKHWATHNHFFSAVSRFGHTSLRSIANSVRCINIINLTDWTIPHSVKILLSKGFSFVPTPNWPTLDSLLISLKTFTRKIRINLLVDNGFLRNNDTRLPPLLVRNQHFNPFKHTDYIKCNDIDLVEDYIFNTTRLFKDTYKIINANRITILNQERNLSREQYQDLNTFLPDDLLIKRADKSAAAVVVTKSDYNHMSLKHSNDADVYIELSKADAFKILHDTRAEILHILKENKRYCGEKVNYDYLIHSVTKAAISFPIFYGLIKDHKPPNIICPKYDTRPVAGAHSWITTGISMWQSIVLQKLCNRLPYVIKNSKDLLIILENHTFSINNILMILDIIKYYPNMNVTDVLTSLKTWMKLLTDCGDLEILFHLKLARMTLVSLIVTFKERYWLQIRDTAMGINSACQFANLFDFFHEVDTYIKFKQNIKLYVRYIDDIFIITRNLQTTFNIFNDLNARHKNIQYTMETSLTTINYLDLKIYKGIRFHRSGLLDTTTFTKPTACKLYPIPSSNHNHMSWRG